MNLYKMVLCSHVQGGQEYRNIFYWTVTADGTLSVAEMNTVADALAVKVAAVCSTACKFYQADWWKLDANSEWQPLNTSVLNRSGSFGDPRLPDTVALVVIGKTAKKRVFGRKFIPCIVTTEAPNGVVSGQALTLMTALGTAWITTLASAGKYVFGNTWTLLNGPNTILTTKNSTVAGSMRRRSARYGNP